VTDTSANEEALAHVWLLPRSQEGKQQRLAILRDEHAKSPGLWRMRARELCGMLALAAVSIVVSAFWHRAAFRAQPFGLLLTAQLRMISGWLHNFHPFHKPVQ